MTGTHIEESRDRVAMSPLTSSTKNLRLPAIVAKPGMNHEGREEHEEGNHNHPPGAAPSLECLNAEGVLPHSPGSRSAPWGQTPCTSFPNAEGVLQRVLASPIRTQASTLSSVTSGAVLVDCWSSHFNPPGQSNALSPRQHTAKPSNARPF